MFRLRFHDRGGQGAKVASRVLGTATFFGGGYYAQGFPLYGAEFFKGSCGEGDI